MCGGHFKVYSPLASLAYYVTYLILHIVSLVLLFEEQKKRKTSIQNVHPSFLLRDWKKKQPKKNTILLACWSIQDTRTTTCCLNPHTLMFIINQSADHISVSRHSPSPGIGAEEVFLQCSSKAQCMVISALDDLVCDLIYPHRLTNFLIVVGPVLKCFCF